MIWVTGRSPTLVSYSLRGVAMNLKATTLTYLAIMLFFIWFIGARNCFSIDFGRTFSHNTIRGWTPVGLAQTGLELYPATL